MRDDLTLAMCPSHGAPTHSPYMDHHEQIPRCPHPRCHRPLERVPVVYRDEYAKAEAEVERLREALRHIASYHEHGKFSAITPAVLASKAQRALDALA